jgi:ankyrin repeat protein
MNSIRNSTPLLIVAGSDRGSETTRMLIAAKANVNVIDDDHLTPLHMAVWMEDAVNTAKMLIEAKADISARRECDPSAPSRSWFVLMLFNTGTETL